MNVPTLKYKVLKPDTHLDCAEFFLCPNCSSNIIRLADGCSVCGWSNRDVLQGGKENCSSNSSDTLDKKLSIPCLIKQPQKPEVKGIIQNDLGDRFTVYIPSNSSTINVSKLLVYPDFSSVGDKLLQGGLSKCSSNCSDTSTKVRSKSENDETIDNCSSNFNSPPCKDLENEEDSKNRGCSKSLDVLAIDKSVGTISNNCSSNSSNPPCTKKKRSAGFGGGYVEYREVKRNHKVYAQYWYHYEFWENGRCIEKKSKYIPKRLVQKIERMNKEKLAVKGILEVLKNKRKK